MTTGLRLRWFLLLLVIVGCVGLALELLLLEHFESWTQWLPFVALGLAVGAAALLGLLPRTGTLVLFRAVMVVLLATGIAGLWLHFAGNRAFELEMDPGLGGWPLAWHSLRGATPALAPAAMIQLGLLGLALAWRWPLSARHPSDDHTIDTERA